MEMIKGGIVLHYKIADNTTTNCYTHPKNVNDEEQLVLRHVAKRDQEKVFYHK
jgi:hypothetical protein